MKTTKILKWFLLIVAMLTISIGSNSQDSTEIKQETEERYRLPTKRELEQEKVKLLETLSNDELLQKEPEKVFAAIKRAKDRKLVEAIPDLTKLLTIREKLWWEGTGVRMHPIPERGYYPAVEALFAIGEPALPALIEVIEASDENSLESDNALDAVQMIFRTNLREAVDYLRRATALPKSAQGRERILVAIEKTEKKIK